MKVRKIKDWLGSFAFALPALFFYCVFLVVPIISTVNISLHKWNGADPEMTWVGAKNYIKVFSDPVFYDAITNNIIWIAVTVCGPLVLGLILAVVLSQPWIKGRMVFRLTYFMPNVISLTAVGIIWSWIVSLQFGIWKKIFTALGMESMASINFLGDGDIVIWFLVFVGSWTCFGFNMVVFLAALQGVDSSYLEVAKLEGANSFQSFFMVTVPMIKGTIVLLVSNSMIGSFKVFDLIYIMTKGGPYHSSEVVATYMYNQTFVLNDYGYGSALAVTLAVIIGICSATFLKFADKDITA